MMNDQCRMMNEDRRIRRSALFALHSAFIILHSSLLLAEPPWAEPIDGDPFPAALVSVDAEWKVTLSTPDGAEKAIPAADLAWWGGPADPPAGQQIVLADGGVLVADVLEAGKDRLAARSDTLGRLDLPLEGLAAVLFHPPADRHQADLLLDEVLSAEGTADVALLTNGDKLSGQVESITRDAVRLQTDVAPVDVDVDRVRAIVFNPSLRRKPDRQGLRAVVGFRDGTRLVVRKLTVDAQRLEMNVLGEAEPPVALEKPLAELVFLHLLGGRAVWLSDLRPASYRHVPYLDLPWPYETDRSVAGGFLRVGGRLYLKGLGVHSAAGLTYKLDGKYRQFRASCAIDDHAAGRGSARFRVYVDRKLKFTSDTVRGNDPPVAVSVPVEGARQLDLLVDYADRADELDHADWLEARLVP